MPREIVSDLWVRAGESSYILSPISKRVERGEVYAVGCVDGDGVKTFQRGLLGKNQQQGAMSYEVSSALKCMNNVARCKNARRAVLGLEQIASCWGKCGRMVLFREWFFSASESANREERGAASTSHYYPSEALRMELKNASWDSAEFNRFPSLSPTAKEAGGVRFSSSPAPTITSDSCTQLREV